MSTEPYIIEMNYGLAVMDPRMSDESKKALAEFGDFIAEEKRRSDRTMIFMRALQMVGFALMVAGFLGMMRF